MLYLHLILTCSFNFEIFISFYEKNNINIALSLVLTVYLVFVQSAIYSFS